MYTDGLMYNKSDFHSTVRDYFPGGENINLLFNSFQGSNEKNGR